MLFYPLKIGTNLDSLAQFFPPFTQAVFSSWSDWFIALSAFPVIGQIYSWLRWYFDLIDLQNVDQVRSINQGWAA